MSAMPDDEIIRSRLLVDERPLKRLIKNFYSIANVPAEEVDSAYAKFVLELDSLETVEAVKRKTSGVAAEEIASYEKEITRIEAETQDAERLVADLKRELATAQQTRRNKIIYDSIAKEALKLPSRSHSAEMIQRLTAELRDLEAEQQKYTLTWSNRQADFASVVRSLEELGEKVKEEKSEQERKDALRDDDVQEDKEDAPKAGEGSSAEDTDTAPVKVKQSLDPNAPAFEPSPLRNERQAADAPAATNEAGDDGMEVDEEGDAQRQTKQPSEGASSRRRSRSASTKEEGEE